MHLASIEKSESPLLPGFLRVGGMVSYDQGDAQPVWFDVPESQEWAINDQGDAWAALLWPEAAVRGENLRIDLPVDPVMQDNLRGLLRLWQSWYKFVQPVELHAPAAPVPVSGTETGQFFSGGVDSLFALLRGLAGPEYPSVPPTSALLTVWGRDVPLSNKEAFASVQALADETARRHGMDAISIVSNIMSLKRSARYAPYLTSGAGFSACGLLLSGRFQNLILGSSLEYGHIVPNGTHPMSDPLFSTSQTRIIHHGTEFTRVEKTAVVAAVPEALAGLRVCWLKGEATNCSRCEKCLRTMATLDSLGKKDQATSFDWSHYGMGAISKVYLPGPLHSILAHDVRTAALKNGRQDIARAVGRSIRRSAIIRSGFVSPMKRVWRGLKKIALLRRLGMPARNFIRRRLAGI